MNQQIILKKPNNLSFSWIVIPSLLLVLHPSHLSKTFASLPWSSALSSLLPLLSDDFTSPRPPLVHDNTFPPFLFLFPDALLPYNSQHLWASSWTTSAQGSWFTGRMMTLYSFLECKHADLLCWAYDHHLDQILGWTIPLGEQTTCLASDNWSRFSSVVFINIACCITFAILMSYFISVALPDLMECKGSKKSRS